VDLDHQAQSSGSISGTSLRDRYSCSLSYSWDNGKSQRIVNEVGACFSFGASECPILGSTAIDRRAKTTGQHVNITHG